MNPEPQVHIQTYFLHFLRFHNVGPGVTPPWTRFSQVPLKVLLPICRRHVQISDLCLKTAATRATAPGRTRGQAGRD